MVLLFKITRKTCSKICICLQRVGFKERAAKDLLDDVYAIFFFLIFFIKAYVVGRSRCNLNQHMPL